MLKIRENDIYRGGEKIGYIRRNDLFDRDGDKLGYWSESAGDIFDRSGKKIGYTEGNHLKDAHGGTVAKLSDIHAHISGGSYDDLVRAAIRMLLGD